MPDPVRVEEEDSHKDAASVGEGPLSIVIPAYNEGDGLLLALEEVATHVLAVVPSAEIIVVDDGSTDGTEDKLSQVSSDYPTLRTLHQENAGHGAALRAGIGAATGRNLLLLDADRQIGLSKFPSHWAHFEDKDLDALLGMRTPRRDPALRLVITRIMRVLIRVAFGASPVDAGVPYKLVRRSAWVHCARMIPPQSAIPSVLLAILLLSAQDLKVEEVPVMHRARRSGKSVLRWGRLARLCSDATKEILSLSQRTHRQQSTRDCSETPRGVKNVVE